MSYSKMYFFKHLLKGEVNLRWWGGTKRYKDLRINPNINNYFIGEQYKCQSKCITNGFWTDNRIVAENDNGSRPIIEWAISKIDLSKNLSILDIGCGPSQKMNKYFGQYKNISITGIDSLEAIKHACRYNPTGSYFDCDLDSDESISKVTRLLNKTYDIIFCFDVIEHVLYPEKMLNLIKQHSNEQTMIFIATLERDISLFVGKGSVGSAKIEHIREWNSIEFKQFIQYMGLQISEELITPLKNKTQFCQSYLCNLSSKQLQSRR